MLNEMVYAGILPKGKSSQIPFLQRLVAVAIVYEVFIPHQGAAMNPNNPLSCRSPIYRAIHREPSRNPHRGQEPLRGKLRSYKRFGSNGQSGLKFNFSSGITSACGQYEPALKLNFYSAFLREC
ncbi:MAG: hypothetical protein PHT15_04640 [Gallionellaceae bacterium]|nr:hypothetical protein [Gallionellaceae bacterium]